jgi:chromosome segregation ATPase
MKPQPTSAVATLLDARALVVLLSAAVTAWATGLWGLLIPGGALYLWLTYRAWQEATDPFAWAEPELQSLAPQYRLRGEAARDLQRRLNVEMRSAPDYLRASLSPIWAEGRELGGRQLGLLRQLQSVEEYLNRLNPQQLRAQERDLLARREAATDGIARMQYEQAHQALVQQRENLESLRTSAQRIDAQLRSVQHSLEYVYGQVLRLKTADVRTGEQVATELNGSLQGMSHQVSSLFDAVEEVFIRSTRGGA